MNINKETEKYIKIVAQCGSISKAAEKLSVSQPAVSSQIKKAETEVGTELFDRSSHPLELTAVGQLVMEYINAKDELSKKLNEDVDAIRSLRSGTIRVGGASAFNLVYLPAVIASFSKKYPDINIQVIDGNMQELVDMTNEGILDMFISSPIGKTEGIDFESLLTTKIYLCVPPDAEVNERLKDKRIPFEDIDKKGNQPETSLTEFEDLPFIRLASERHLGRLLDYLLDNANMDKQINIRVDQSITAYQMTSKGIGVCLMSGVDIRNIAVDKRPAFYMIDAHHCIRDMYLATRKNRKLSAAARIFAEEVRETVRLFTK